jgi:hypothetical protein
MTNESCPIWTEGICGDGAAILKDGVMQPIEDVIAALNAAELAQSEPIEITDEGLLKLTAKELGYEFSSDWFLTGRNCPRLETTPVELLNFAYAILALRGFRYRKERQ